MPNKDSGSKEGGPSCINYFHTLPTVWQLESCDYVAVPCKTNLEDSENNLVFKLVSDERVVLDPYHTYIFTEMQIVNGDDSAIQTEVETKIENKRQIEFMAPKPHTLGPDEPAAKPPGEDPGAGATASTAPVKYETRTTSFIEEFTRKEANQEAHVFPVNGIGSAIFKNIDVKLNDELISKTDNLYAYKGDMCNRLFYSEEVKRNSLSLSGFDEEPFPFDDFTEAELDFVNAPSAVNRFSTFKRRWDECSFSKLFYSISRIHSEIFDQPKLLPPKSTLHLDFSRSDSKFCLLTKHEKSYKIKITRAVLISRQVTLAAQVLQDLNARDIDIFPMLYPVVKTRMFSFNASPGTTNLADHSMLGDLVPRRMFIAVVDNLAFHGQFARDPFNYGTYDVQEVNLTVGNKNRPFSRIDMNYHNDNFLWPLFGLLDSIESFLGRSDCGINKRNYTSRNVIYGFNLSAVHQPPGSCFVPKETRKISINITTNRATTKTLTVVIMAEYDSEIRIWGPSRDNQITVK